MATPVTNNPETKARRSLVRRAAIVALPLAVLATAGVLLWSPQGMASASGAAQIRTVSSVDELTAALHSARDGSEIRLMAGRYPIALLRGIQIKGNATISSADPANPATFTGLTLRDCAGMTFRNLKFEGAAAGLQYHFLVLNSDRITLDALAFVGPAIGVDKTVNSALMLRNSRDIAVTRSHFSGFWHGLSLLDVESLTIKANEFRAMQTDAIRGGGGSNLLIAENVISEFHPAPGDHPDGIQLWSTHQTVAARNIVIRDNLVVRGAGAPTQGIFIRDTLDKLPFENVEISGNLAIGTMFNGIAISGVTGGRITGNEVIAHPDAKSWIRVQNAKAVELHDNRAMVFLIMASPGVTQKGNQITSPTNKAISAKIADWLDARPAMRDAAGPLLTELAARPAR